ncbi:MAG TPA: DUF4112 domain-containing protein [Gemmatimonadaceae bacterium]|nr:DUF4112 domain-containing protein [Gemmatimonadaceae bacterium]
MSRTNPRVEVGGGGIVRDDPASRTRRVRVLAQLLDNSITVPGTGWKIGLDPIVGLIPGIGDLIGAVLSAYIILEAARAEVPGFVLVRMLANLGFDTLVGAVPAVGDVFDAAWKSNTRNVALLERHLSKQADVPVSGRRTSVGPLVLTIIALLVIVGVGLLLGIFVARLIWNMSTR